MSKYRRKLEETAERLKIPGYKLLTNEELNVKIKDYSGKSVKQEPAVIEAKATEVKSTAVEPSKSASQTVEASGPRVQSAYYGQPINMAINVPVPAVNLQNRPAPAWWEVAAECRNAALYMICGAALYALVTVKLM